jgi:proprotein convertase subtilisin/kexin type 5
MLSLYDNVCVNSCPAGFTIENSVKRVCEVCDPVCRTCKNKPSQCTSCVDTLNLRKDMSICVGECSLDDSMVGVNNVCTSCDSSCASCQRLPTECLTCSPTKFFYNYTCITQCPLGYAPSTKRRCALDGLNCPFGYEPNALGNACMLSV